MWRGKHSQTLQSMQPLQLQLFTKSIKVGNFLHNTMSLCACQARPSQSKPSDLTLPPTPDAHALGTSCSPVGVCRTKLLGLRNRPGLQWCYRPSVCPSRKTRKGKGTWFQNIMDLVTMPQRGALSKARFILCITYP